jgi:hypothetical protein
MKTRVPFPIAVLAAALLGLMVVGAPGEAATTLVVDDDGMASATNCNASDPAYTTISAAVLDASNGDTIQVCPGTYIENIVLDKSLTLKGAQAGVDARGRVTPDESVVTPLVVTIRTLELRTGSLNSIIDGFTFVGGNRPIESTSGPTNGLQLLNNRIQGFSDNSVFLNRDGINITVDQNDLDGTAKTSAGGVFHLDTDNFDGFHFTNNRVVNGITGTGFFVDGNRNVDKGTPTARTPLFSGNFIDRNLTGVNLGSRAWGDGPITGNIFSNNLSEGLQGGPKNSTISQNTFDRNGGNGLSLTSFGSTDPSRGAQNNTITQNCFTRNGFSQAGAGIRFSATQAAGTISTNVAHQNNITGNAMGARYPVPGPETIDAQLNWWGAANGPGLPDGSGSGDGVDGHGQIDFMPFLTSVAAGTPCTPLPPATLMLSPPTATNDVDTQHTVTATVKDVNGIPVANVTVRFTVTGSVNTTGNCTTNMSGTCTFTYTGPALPGSDAITAFADSNNNGTLDPGEPVGVASKFWTVPLSTPLCQVDVTYGGWIHANNGDRANFGGNARVDSQGNPLGQEQYQDQGPVQPMNVHSINVLAVVCPGNPPTEASIFGTATIDGAGSYDYRIDVKDVAESGRGADTYRIRLSTVPLYDSGEHTLEGGNVTIHK